MTLDACAELVAKGDPERFAALMAAPVAARAAMLPLFALNLEVAKAPWVTAEPMIALMRLQWWRDVVAEPVARAHEVAGPLHALIHAQHLPLATIDAMIAAREWDVARDPHLDEGALWDYLLATSGNLMWLCALALGAPVTAEGAVKAIGAAQGLANYLRAVPELQARGRDPLPEGWQVLLPQALAVLNSPHGLPKPARAALYAAYLAAPVLRKALANPQAVYDHGLEPNGLTRRWRLFLTASGRLF